MIDPTAATAAVTALFTLLASDKSVKKLGSDFTSTVVDTVRPWLLVEDDPMAPATEAAIKELEAGKALSPVSQAILQPKLEEYLVKKPEALPVLQNLIANGEQVVVNNAQKITNVDNRGANIGKQINDLNVEGDFTM